VIVVPILRTTLHGSGLPSTSPYTLPLFPCVSILILLLATLCRESGLLHIVATLWFFLSKVSFSHLHPFVETSLPAVLFLERPLLVYDCVTPPLEDPLAYLTPLCAFFSFFRRPTSIPLCGKPNNADQIFKNLLACGWRMLFFLSFYFGRFSFRYSGSGFCCLPVPCQLATSNLDGLLYLFLFWPLSLF